SKSRRSACGNAQREPPPAPQQPPKGTRVSRHRTVAARKRGALGRAATHLDDYAGRAAQSIPKDSFTDGFIAGLLRAAELIRDTQPTNDQTTTVTTRRTA